MVIIIAIAEPNMDPKIPALSGSLLSADVKNVERFECLYNTKWKTVQLKAYNNNDKDIYSITISLSNEDDKLYKFKKENPSKNILIPGLSAKVVTFEDILFKPKKCRVVDVKFKNWIDWFWTLFE